MIKIVSIATILLLGVGLASAHPPGKGSMSKHRTLQSSEDYESVKKGDSLLMVCMQCKTVTEMTAESGEQVMELCKEGNTIHCPSCKKSYKTVRHGPPGKKHSSRKVTIVNSQGEECMFIAKEEALQ